MRLNSFPKLGKPTKYGFRYSPGFKVNQKGELAQQIFWLGSDVTKASIKRSIIEQFYSALAFDKDEKFVWTAEQLENVQKRLDAVDREPIAQPVTTLLQPQFFSEVIQRTEIPATSIAIPQPTVIPAPIQVHSGPKYNLHEALDQFAVYTKNQHDKSATTRDRTCHHITSVKYHLPDQPLYNMTYDDLQNIRTILTARPLARRMKDAKKDIEPRPVGVITVRNWLRLLGQAFRWFRKTGRWKKPSELEMEDFQAIFGLSKKQQLHLARTTEEKARLINPNEVPSVHELAVYYKLAVPQQRLYLLMGIFLGWRQMQISELRRCEIRVRNNEYFIDFQRTKTGVQGSLWVCPELAELLIKVVQRTPKNEDDRALLSLNGLPLVHRSLKGNTCCSITQVWDRLRKQAEKAGVAGYPFSALRRFAGQSVVNVGDPFMAQVFLAQGVDSVLEQHYAARGIGIGIGQTAFQKLYEVQKRVYHSLKPLFDAANKPTSVLLDEISKERIMQLDQSLSLPISTALN